MQGRLSSNAPEITTLLFDLDGTLVDMKRVGLALRLLARAIWRYAGAIRPWRFRKAVKEAIHRMQHHGTDKTNYEVFVETLGRHSSKPLEEIDRRSRLLVSKDFAKMGGRFRSVPGARETLVLARRLGYRVVLATNPVWPLAAVRMRLEFGGLGDFEFDYITHSEIMTRCKPDPGYYRQLLERIGTEPSRCLMIGNDPRKDLPAKDVGVATFLLREEPVSDVRLDGWGTHTELQEILKRWAQSRSLSA